MPKRHILLTLVLAVLLASCAPGTPTPSGVAPVVTTVPPPTSTATPSASTSPGDALIILSLNEGGYAHLFAWSLSGKTLTRLTSGLWNDVTPALSPDGRYLAFASDRNNYWDIYLLDLQSGDTVRLTDSPEYDAAPSWSPDGRWLAHETYIEENLEIVIRPVSDPTQTPIRLTTDPGADHSPSWSPQGRKIAFVSTRDGESDIYLADLDRTGDERFTNLTLSLRGAGSHPTWSPDGRILAFGWQSLAYSPTLNGIYLWDGETPQRPPQRLADGDWPAWSADGTRLLSLIAGPNQDYIALYNDHGDLLLPPIPLPGEPRGLIWGAFTLPSLLPEPFRQAAAQTPTPLWAPAVTPIAEGPRERWAVVPLPDVQAPYPQLHDLVDEAFAALRQRLIQELGWDALANLQNAYVPLTTPLDPGQEQDWLYTGRAFALPNALLDAGWMVAVRQDFGQETYWRLYLRSQAQDGSMGEPLHALPWDLNARYNLDPQAYEAGGQFAASVPTGYWVDVTALARAYGWERLPALANWRTYFHSARFAEFVLTGGLDWETAMLELYPPDVFITPTAVIIPTRTPTATPTNYQTPTPTLTPTPWPTFTPAP